MKKKEKRLLKNTTGCKSRIKLVTQTGGHITTVFQHAHPNRDIFFHRFCCHMFLQSIWLSEMHKPPTHEHYLLSVISILNESIPTLDLSVCVLSGNARGNKLCL